MTAAGHPRTSLAASEDTVAALVGVTKRYGDTTVLDDVTLSVKANQIVVVTGPSGTGKSTAIRVLMGLETPDTGQAWLLGTRVDVVSGREKAALLRRVGIGFQDPLLDGARTVLENLTGLGRVNGRFDDHRTQDVLRLGEIADGFGLTGLLSRQAAVLSGGQKLRVALGRALVAKPEILLLDELTHMVDTAGKAAIYSQLERLVRATRIAALIISHDDESLAICDRLIDLSEG
jgi:ABC-type multidrug transport system ATPase subunit